jgi:hypothetical protein
MFVGADKQAVGIDMLDTTACYSGWFELCIEFAQTLRMG